MSNVPQNRVRIYLVCKLKDELNISLNSDVGHSDSHKFKKSKVQLDIFEDTKVNYKTVKDVIEKNVDEKYLCSETFTGQLSDALDGEPF